MSAMELATGAPSSNQSTGKQRKATPDDFIFGKIIGEGSFSTVSIVVNIRLHFNSDIVV